MSACSPAFTLFATYFSSHRPACTTCGICMATTLLRAGEAVHVVSNRLGHADPAITLRVYAHVINESSPLAAMAFAEAVARLDDEDDEDDADRDE